MTNISRHKYHSQLFSEKRTKVSMSRTSIVAAGVITLLLLAIHNVFFSQPVEITTSDFYGEKIMNSFNLQKEAKVLEAKFVKEGKFNDENNDVSINEGKIFIDELTSVPYLHCGSKYSGTSSSQPKELLMLHGMKFTKDTWVQSSILPTLCHLDPHLSVIAADLPATADGKALEGLFRGLVKENIFSGKPVVIVSPSASGKSVLGLLEMSLPATERNEKDAVASQILRGWIPVACGSIQKSSDDILNRINHFQIPVLAIYGNLDKTGKIVSEKLDMIGKSNVEVVEMHGGHPVYLDDTAKFISFVVLFVNHVNNVNI